ncbi:rhomboid family intramembrane serine protease [Sagittula sp. P11]|uniref:rhomboid family intramembrane serine protease n=1 Tax=Sagittula sp. P11 TaxID=2009329 RepID=UPI000C2D4872|nr:rhomboid family intramembrane serine protease [Sagittula sp. P11]AUC52989.1 rhomboid family intramembrane serine protease [Sagittula sp. P11]
MFPIRDHNPSGRTPFVTYTLIAINSVVFLMTLDAINDLNFLATYSLVPRFLSEGFGYQGLVTSMFLHGGWMHIIGNMLYLYIFGDNLEDRMGHVAFLLFYLAAGLGAGLIHYASAPYSNVPTVGASGAIAGVMGGYLLLFPRARVDILIFIVIIIKVIPIPAWVALCLWFVMQLFGGVGTSADEGGVAYWAHIGGFVIGLVLTLPVFLKLGGPRFWRLHHGHPPHPEARTRWKPGSSVTRVPRIRRK